MNTLLDTAEPWLRNIATLSWKGALLTLAVGLVMLLLRRHLSPTWRHGLWLLVLLRFVVPDLGTSSLSMNRIPQVPVTLSTQTPNLPEFLPTSQPVELAMAQVETAPPVMPAPLQAKPLTTPAPEPWTLWQKLTLVWLLGVAVVFAAMLALHLRLLWRLRHDASEPSTNITALLQTTCTLAGIRWTPRLIITDAIYAPALFGIIRPVILLPRELAASGDAASLKLILLHELAHLQRRDLWAQIIASLIIALHWFNPIVWWAGRRMRAEAEMAADARALRNTDVSIEAHRLGEVLLGFAHRATAGWLVWFATSTLLGISENKRDLKRRIEALMDIAKGRRTRWIVGLGIFMLLAVVGLTKAPAEDAKKPETKEAERVLVPASGNKPKSDEPHTGVETKVTPRPLVKKSQVTITGTVVSKENGKPIAGAQVVFCSFFGSDKVMSILPSGSPATTDESGSYVFEASLFKERGLVLIHAPGKEVTKQIIESPKDGSRIKLHHLLAMDDGIKGTVVDAKDKPVQGASLMLSTRSLFLRDTPLRQSGFLYTRSISGYWIGEPSSDADGAFSGHSFNQDKTATEWLVVTHPEHGIQKVRMSEWKNASRVHLEPWATLEGLVLDEKDQPIPHAALSLGRTEIIRSEAENSTFHISQPIECVTDAQGRFLLKKVLPGMGSTYAKCKDAFFDMRLRPLNPGDIQKVTLRPRQQKLSPSARDLRDIVGRIILPGGKAVRSEEHEVEVSLRLDGEQSSHSVNEPDDKGRFWTRPKPPGDYQITIWVQPKGSKLIPAPDSGFTRRFKLEKNAENKPLDLGEMPLQADDFAFVPAKTDTKVKSVRHADQRLNAPAVDATTFATWSACGGSGTTEEKAFEANGHVRGIAPVSSSGFFMIRATKSDGSKHYSEVLTCTKDTAEEYQQPLTFRPGTALKGKVTDVPKDTADQAWVVAAVKVQNPLPPNSTHIGWLPTLTWYAWTLLKADGSFHFPTLPRGSLRLVAFGEGWVSSRAEDTSPEILADLTEAKPVYEVTLSTQTCYDKNLRLILADGSPLIAAKVSLVLTENTGLQRAWGRWGHAIEPEDKDAYQRYKKTSISGHSATTDPQGHVTLSNLLYRNFGPTEGEVEWTDAKSGKSQTNRIKFSVGLKARETITVQPGSSNQ